MGFILLCFLQGGCAYGDGVYLPVACTFSHIFLLYWVTLVSLTRTSSPPCRLTLGSQLSLQIQLYLLALVNGRQSWPQVTGMSWRQVLPGSCDRKRACLLL